MYSYDNVPMLVHSCTNIRSGTSGGSHCVPTVPTPPPATNTGQHQAGVTSISEACRGVVTAWAPHQPSSRSSTPSPLSRDTVRAVEAGEAVRVPPLDQAGVMSSLGSVAPASGLWCAALTVLRDPHSSTDRDWGLLSVPHWLQIDTL